MLGETCDGILHLDVLGVEVAVGLLVHCVLVDLSQILLKFQHCLLLFPMNKL